MATSIVSPEMVSGILEGKVKRKIDNPFTGKEVIAQGEYLLPIARTIQEAEGIVGGKSEDLLFWFNHGRKVAARAQVNSALGFDLGSDELNDLFKSFTNAMENIVGKSADEKKRAKVKEFILSEDKFEPLREKFAGDWNPEGVIIDFASTEIKKPTGVRGRPGKDEDSE